MNEERPKKPKKKSLMSFYKFSTSTFTKHSLINPKSNPKIPIPPSISQDHVVEKPIVVQSNKTQNHMIRDIFELETCNSNERKKGCRGGGGGAAEEGRKSVSHVERDTAARIAAAAEMLTVRILAADMPGFMQAHAFRCARMTLDSLEKFSSKHMAFNLKKEFDKGYGPAWHCIVGSSFGSFVTHSTGCFFQEVEMRRLKRLPCYPKRSSGVKNLHLNTPTALIRLAIREVYTFRLYYWASQ